MSRWASPGIVRIAAALASRFLVLQTASLRGQGVETFGTSEIDQLKLAKVVEEQFDMRPAAIIERLDLRRPIYKRTAAYGHFGRSEPDFTWERTDQAADFRKACEALA